MNQNFQPLGFGPADILLPRVGTDMTKWAVVACDQFTSQPEYWQAVEETVGNAPSTLRLILPEARLGEDAEDDITAYFTMKGERVRSKSEKIIADELIPERQRKK